MEDRDIRRRLEGFENVWKRVSAAGSAGAAAQAKGLKLMPGKSRAAGKRYKPGRG